jgi:arginase
MDVCLIDVPSTIGDERHGASTGAARLLASGAADRAAAGGGSVTVERVERVGPFGDCASSSADVNARLAAAVSRTIAGGRLPVVLAGSCDACLGTLAGFDHASCGVVWFDAHGDFNTPESTVSGFFPGMSLAIAAGHCYRGLWGRIGDNTPVPESAILLLGVRDLSPRAERERLERSEIAVVEWRDGRTQQDVDAAIDDLARHVDEVYVHVDLDALDREVAPGIVDPPVPGGLSLRQLEDALVAVTARFRLRAAALTTFDPERDPDGRTLRAALRIVELLAGAPAPTP